MIEIKPLALYSTEDLIELGLTKHNLESLRSCGLRAFGRKWYSGSALLG